MSLHSSHHDASNTTMCDKDIETIPNLSVSIPSSCPFSIRKLNASTYLIREHDRYGEYPNIYAKFLSVCRPFHHSLIVLSDTGCGTEVLDSTCDPARTWNIASFVEYVFGSIAGGNAEVSLVIVSTHCHYDHIMGIRHFLPSGSAEHSHKVIVVSSSHSPDFITPYCQLQKHSQCDTMHLEAPHYEVGIWAGDRQRLTIPISGETSQSKSVIDTGLIILHTPGHTPDSLSWYDETERHVSVGDSLYERESRETRDPKWGREPPMPTIFNSASDLGRWWGSLGRVLEFVRARNEEIGEDRGETREGMVGTREGTVETMGTNGKMMENIVERMANTAETRGNTSKEKVTVDESPFPPGDDNDDDDWIWVRVAESDNTSGPSSVDHSTQKSWMKDRQKQLGHKKKRVTLSSAHVTVSTDAESCLLAMREFVARVLRDEVPFVELGDGVGLWDYLLRSDQDHHDEVEGGTRQCLDDDDGGGDGLGTVQPKRNRDGYRTESKGRGGKHTSTSSNSGHDVGDCGYTGVDTDTNTDPDKGKGGDGDELTRGRFSVRAPVDVIERGRKEIPRSEWEK